MSCSIYCGLPRGMAFNLSEYTTQLQIRAECKNVNKWNVVDSKIRDTA
jgi:hypothetical protein